MLMDMDIKWRSEPIHILGSLISENGHCTKDIRIEMAKKVFMEKKKLFTGKMNLELKKRLMKL